MKKAGDVRARLEAILGHATEATGSAQVSETNEDVWRTWFKEAGGTYWTVPENMPEAARDPWNNYCHYRNNQPTSESAAHKAQAAEAFKKATGFDAEAVCRFKDFLNNILDKK